MGDWGATRLAFTALVVVINGALAVNIFCGVYGVCIVYELFGMNVVKFTAFVAFMRHSGQSFLWRSGCL